MNTSPDTSWLHGMYPEINAVINTKIPFVSIEDYFWRGEEADKVIEEIHKIWMGNELTVQESIQKWSFYYLSND